MKATKALKRLEKAEALLSVVIERYAVSDDSVQQALRAAKTSLVRASQLVKAQPAASKKTASDKPAKKLVAPKTTASRTGASDAAGKNVGRRAPSKAQTNGSRSPQQAVAAAG